MTFAALARDNIFAAPLLILTAVREASSSVRPRTVMSAGNPRKYVAHVDDEINILASKLLTDTPGSDRASIPLVRSSRRTLAVASVCWAGDSDVDSTR